MRARRVGTAGVVLLLACIGTACVPPLPSRTETPDPSPPVPPGYAASIGGWCSAALPADWTDVGDYSRMFEGAHGRTSLDTFTTMEPDGMRDKLPKFVGYNADTTLRVISRERVQVPGAEAAFQLRLTGADGSTHLLTYGYDEQEGKECYLISTPADATAEEIAGTFVVGEG